jgi:hypothetical protein
MNEKCICQGNPLAMAFDLCPIHGKRPTSAVEGQDAAPKPRWVCDNCKTEFAEYVNGCPKCSEKGIRAKVASWATPLKYEFDADTMTLTLNGSLLATFTTTDDFPCAESDNGWDEGQKQLGEYIAEHLNAGHRALTNIAADAVKAPSQPEPNPSDCTCEHVHASDTTCRSKKPSRGAVPESERIFKADVGASPTPASQSHFEEAITRTLDAFKAGNVTPETLMAWLKSRKGDAPVATPPEPIVQKRTTEERIRATESMVRAIHMKLFATEQDDTEEDSDD